MICNCLDPVLIINPSINQSIVRFDKYFLNGVPRNIDNEQRLRILDGEKVSRVLGIPFAHNLSKFFLDKLNKKDRSACQFRFQSYINSCFFYNSETQECLPIYQFVPCGKCDVCQSKKLSSYVQRVQFAIAGSKVPAYFVTLTFNDAHYPNDDKDKSVFKRPLQLWKKRIKRRLDFMKLDSSSVKFFCVSEFGIKTGRLHFHCLVFGMPLLCDNLISNKYKTLNLFQFCWRDVHRTGLHIESFDEYIRNYPKCFDFPSDYDPYSYGFVNVKEINNPSSAVHYVVKYALKDIQEGNFKSISINLGLQFALELKKTALNNPDGSFSYCDPFGLHLVSGNFCSYYLKKLFPPESKIFPIEFRRALYNSYSIIETLLADKGLSKEFKSILLVKRMHLMYDFPLFNGFDLDFFGKAFLGGNVFDSGFSDVESFNHDYLNLLDEYEKILYNFDFAGALVILNERCEYFRKRVDRQLTLGELNDISNKFIKSIKNYQSKSVLL